MSEPDPLEILRLWLWHLRSEMHVDSWDELNRRAIEGAARELGIERAAVGRVLQLFD